MDKLFRQYGNNIKIALLSNDSSKRMDAILEINLYLKQLPNDLFVKILLDLDIQYLLLNQLILMQYPSAVDVLHCFEYLCSHKMYFIRDNAVTTMETLLKVSYFLIIKQLNKEEEEFLKRVLQLIIKLVSRLNNFTSSKKLPVESLLNTIPDILSKPNLEFINIAITAYTTLLESKHLQRNLDEYVIDEMITVWTLCINKLAEILPTNPICVRSLLAELCFNGLRFYEKEKCQLEASNNGTQLCKVTLKYSCESIQIINPDVMLNINVDPRDAFKCLYVLNTLLKSDLSIKNLTELCKHIIHTNGFIAIAKYINVNTSITDLEVNHNTRVHCFNIICEMIIILWNSDQLEAKRRHEMRMQLLEDLNPILEEKDWLTLLGRSDLKIHSKMSIILFCSIYYAHSQNSKDLQSTHLTCLVKFMNGIPSTIKFEEQFLKELWFLFAFIYTWYPKNAIQSCSLHKAQKALQKYLLPYTKQIESVCTLNPCLIYWISSVHCVNYALKLSVFHFMLRNTRTNEQILFALISIANICEETSKTLLEIASKDAPNYALPATEVLNIALKGNNLMKNSNFKNVLHSNVLLSIREISEGHASIQDKVINAISMLKLGTSSILVDNDTSQYSAVSFIILIGSIGYIDTLPTIFYVSCFEYMLKLLQVSQDEVFLTFMNSERNANILVMALLSEDNELSIMSSKIILNLLKYQHNNNLKSGVHLKIYNFFIVKLINVNNVDLLKCYLSLLIQMLKSSCTISMLLNVFPIDEQFIKGLYLRCLYLLCQPGYKKIDLYCYKCAETLLYNTSINDPNTHQYLLSHPSNHTLIMMNSDQETNRSFDENFLKFIYMWLGYVCDNMKTVFNTVSICHMFWRKTLYQIVRIIKIIDDKHLDLKLKIREQLLKFIDILPKNSANYLLGITSNPITIIN